MNSDDSAYPFLSSSTVADNNTYHVGNGGLTKREYIAIQLLNGFLSSGRKDTVINNVIIKAPEAAVILADELIVQLNKGDSK